MKKSLEQNKSLEIAAFWDNRPGHQKQTRGLVLALKKLTSIDVRDIFLPEPGLKSGAKDILRLIASGAGINILPDVDARGNALPASADIIIGTGSRTHAPMLVYKKKYGGRVITCMTPNPPLDRAMDLCFVPVHDNPKPAGNIITTLGPPNTAPMDHAQDSSKGLILMGGTDPKNHIWETDKILGMISDVLQREKEIFWTISSSPRTPADMLPMLDKLAGKNSNAAFFRSSDTQKGWIEKKYGESMRVWVSADSASMIYEALTAGCKVGVMPVIWKNQKRKLKKGLDSLYEKNMVLDYTAWQKQNAPWPDAPPLDEAGRCAKEILKKWWPERLK